MTTNVHNYNTPLIHRLADWLEEKHSHPSTVSACQYHLAGRVALLTVGLISVSTAISHLAIGYIAGLGYLLSGCCWKKADEFATTRLFCSLEALSAYGLCLDALLDPNQLSRTLNPPPPTVLRSSSLPSIRDRSQEQLIVVPAAVQTTSEQETLIRTTLSEIASKSIFDLLWHQKRLKVAAKQLKAIHPLACLKYILCTPELKAHLKAISQDPRKRPMFLNILSKQLNNCLFNNQLIPWLHQFSYSVGISPGNLLPFTGTQDWEGFVETLLKANTHYQ